MTRLVVDIGGTSTRVAHKFSNDSDVKNAEQFVCADYEVVDVWLVQCCARHKLIVDELVLAVAGPVSGPKVDITNNHWHFDAGSLATTLGAQSYLLINDFTAQALAHCNVFFGKKTSTNQDLKCLRKGKEDLATPIIVIGPGTGLGVAALVCVGSDVKVIEGEGGHVSYSPRTLAETLVFSTLQKQFGHVSAERIVSGPGLEAIYKIQTSESKLASEIGALALAGNGCALAAVNLMLQSLATVAANVTISFGAKAGIVIAGGIVPKLAPLLDSSGFIDRFNDHGRRSSYLEPIPIYLSTNPFAALRGASNAFENKYLKSKICHLV